MTNWEGGYLPRYLRVGKADDDLGNQPEWPAQSLRHCEAFGKYTASRLTFVPRPYFMSFLRGMIHLGGSQSKSLPGPSQNTQVVVWSVLLQPRMRRQFDIDLLSMW